MGCGIVGGDTKLDSFLREALGSVVTQARWGAGLCLALNWLSPCGTPH
jgi:hypothetical protein